jgi:hypothetical protein
MQVLHLTLFHAKKSPPTFSAPRRDVPESHFNIAPRHQSKAALPADQNPQSDPVHLFHPKIRSRISHLRPIDFPRLTKISRAPAKNFRPRTNTPSLHKNTLGSSFVPFVSFCGNQRKYLQRPTPTTPRPNPLPIPQNIRALTKSRCHHPLWSFLGIWHLAFGHSHCPSVSPTEGRVP